MDYMILIWPDGTPVALDLPSGGYPVKAYRIHQGHVWNTEQERERYQEMFKDQNFKKAILRVEVIEG